jgi:hypothetical protein
LKLLQFPAHFEQIFLGVFSKTSRFRNTKQCAIKKTAPEEAVSQNLKYFFVLKRNAAEFITFGGSAFHTGQNNQTFFGLGVKIRVECHGK